MFARCSCISGQESSKLRNQRGTISPSWFARNNCKARRKLKHVGFQYRNQVGFGVAISASCTLARTKLFSMIRLKHTLYSTRCLLPLVTFVITVLLPLSILTNFSLPHLSLSLVILQKKDLPIVLLNQPTFRLCFVSRKNMIIVKTILIAKAVIISYEEKAELFELFKCYLKSTNIWQIQYLFKWDLFFR